MALRERLEAHRPRAVLCRAVPLDSLQEGFVVDSAMAARVAAPNDFVLVVRAQPHVQPVQRRLELVVRQAAAPVGVVRAQHLADEGLRRGAAVGQSGGCAHEVTAAMRPHTSMPMPLLCHLTRPAGQGCMRL